MNQTSQKTGNANAALAAIRAAPNLDALAKLVNAVCDAGERDEQDLTLQDRLDAIDSNWLADLPTFGGAEPSDTRGVYSWDETRLLVSDVNGDLVIEDREVA